MVGLLQTLTVAFGAWTVVEAGPLKVARAECTNPKKRVEWRALTDDQKAAYLEAQVCIIQSPAKSEQRLPGAKTRWDELVSLHQIHALQIHTSGQFLPYHRYFLHAHEQLLSECGYDDVLPYWDETQDAGAFSKSEIFDPMLGFGGSGSGSGNCLTNGPFVNLTVNIGPGFTTEPRCVNRRITDFLSTQCGQSYVDAALDHDDFLDALDGIYSGPHLYGHMALAMMDGDSITSPGDPLFIMHHGFVDKMWSDWQALDPPNRLFAIDGLNAQDPDIGFSEFPGDMEAESAMWGHPSEEMLAVTPDPEAGDGGKMITLGHIMSSLGVIPDATVEDVMDIQGGYLCYEYV